MMTPRNAGIHDSAHKAIDLLEKQIAVCDELTDLAGRQRDLIAARDSGGLLRVLHQRQQAIESLLRLQAEMTPIADCLTRNAGSVEPALRERLRSLIDGVEARLGRVISSDEDDHVALEGRLDEVGREIESGSTGRTAHRAYARTRTACLREGVHQSESGGTGAPDQPRPRFTDRRG